MNVENQQAKSTQLRRCHSCGQRTKGRMTRPYSYEVSHDGRPPVTITIPDLEVIDCANPDCPGHESGESLIFDAAATRRITIETYRQLGLLTPDEIRQARERLGLTQAELQELMGLGGNTLSRWENARVYQSRSMDNLMRLAAFVPEALKFLKVRHMGHTFRASGFSYLPVEYRESGHGPTSFFDISSAA